MKPKKLTIFLILGIVVITIIILASIRIYFINAKFPDPNIIEHTVNEVISGGDTSISILESKLIDGNELKQMLPTFEDQVQNPDGSKVRNEQIRELMVTIKLINNTGAPQKMLLVQMYAESLIWVNGIDGSLYPLLNPNNPNPMEVSLEPYQEVEVTLPYTLYEFQFQPKDWNDIENREFDLTLSFYPNKHIVNL